MKERQDSSRLGSREILCETTAAQHVTVKLAGFYVDIFSPLDTFASLPHAPFKPVRKRCVAVLSQTVLYRLSYPGAPDIAICSYLLNPFNTSNFIPFTTTHPSLTHPTILYPDLFYPTAVFVTIKPKRPAKLGRNDPGQKQQAETTKTETTHAEAHTTRLRLWEKSFKLQTAAYSF